MQMKLGQPPISEIRFDLRSTVRRMLEHDEMDHDARILMGISIDSPGTSRRFHTESGRRHRQRPKLDQAKN